MTPIPAKGRPSFPKTLSGEYSRYSARRDAGPRANEDVAGVLRGVTRARRGLGRELRAGDVLHPLVSNAQAGR
jgi:hypothetical protein